jgi:outer membrane receptor protein involved in Fe transport
MMPIASAIAAAIHPAFAQEQTSSGSLQEVVVTATKHAESLQNVPISIVAINTEQLQNLNINNQDEYVKFLPSVTVAKGGIGGGANGPGYGQVTIRGVTADAGQNHSASLPTVGTYLDEQPITTIQGAMDVHLYDIARVEVLAGPQGTLYGASSEAGTIRIITNQPDPSKFSAEYQLEGNDVAHGQPGGTAQGFVNIPLGSSAAIRLVGWYQYNGGFIDNVYGTRTFTGAPDGVQVAPPAIPPTVTINNAAYAKNDFNSVQIYGGRAALKINLDDNWTITPFVMMQSTTANGFGAYAPNVGDLEVMHFSPDGVQDNFVDTALTIEGKISNFDLTYAGAYLKRHDAAHTDYSDYSLAYNISAPSYTAPIVGNNGQPIDLTQRINSKDGYEKISQELRLSSPQDWRLRFIVGGFYQRQLHNIQQDYQIVGLAGPSCTYTATVAPATGCSMWVSGWQDTWWLTQQQRVDRDYAGFGEATFDITPKLSLLAGVRYFSYDNSLEGYRGYGLHNPLGANSLLGEQGTCNFAVQFQGAPCLSFNKSTSGTGTTPKVTLTYKFDSERLIYFTYSKGFRPGGINRVGNYPPYQADYLINYEFGWKTTWLDNHLRYNGAFFLENWQNFQFSFLGPNGLTRVANAGAAQITGMENELAWAVTKGLTLNVGLTLLDPKLTEDYCGTYDANNNPVTNCPSLPPLAPNGQQLPYTSKVKGDLIARYDFPLGGWLAYGQGAFVYQSAQQSELRTIQRGEIGEIPAFSTLDLAVGVARNSYSIDFFLNNVFDERGQLFRFTQCGSCSQVNNYVVPTQPRTVALRFTQKF